MTTYKLKEDIEGRTRKTFVKTLPLVFLASLPVLIMAFMIREEAPYLLYLMLFFIVSATVIAYFLSSKRRTSFLLTVDQDTISLRQSGKDNVSITRNEIEKIIDENSGIRIKSIDPSVEIFVPGDLVDYEKLKSELSSWASLESGGTSQTRQIVTILVVCLLLIGGYLTKNPIFGYTLIAMLAVYLVVIYSQNFKAMMVTKDKWKRVRIIISFVLFGLIILSYILKELK